MMAIEVDGHTIPTTASREFLFEYHFGGATWGTSVFADSPDEAREKIKAMGMARYIGECHARIPAVPGGGLIADLLCWWKNRGTWSR